ncbi:MAG TPA: hypothetical protein VF181_04185 [Balneolaceae bacterium]
MKGYSFKIKDLLILTFLLITGLAAQSEAQIVIEERMELGQVPFKSKSNKISIQSHGDGHAGVFPRFSGSIVLKLFPFWEEELKHEWELYERNFGKLSGIIDWHEYTTVEISGFKQWQKLDFYLKRTDADYERHILNSKIVSPNDTTFITFDSIEEDNPSRPGIHFPSATITFSKADSSKPAIPSEGFFNYWWSPPNIYLPIRPITIDEPGFLIVKVNKVRDDVNYELHMDLPTNKILTTNLNSVEGDTLWVGYFTPSEKIRLFIKSSHKIVQGIPIYPYVLNHEDYGVFKELIFEGWTDLRFDDINIELLLRPHPKEPSHINLTIKPEPVMVGDTALVNVYAKRENGEIISFDKNHPFDVEIATRDEYVTLLHPNGKNTADSFENIPLGFKVIADNPDLPRSLYAKIEVSTRADGPLIKDKFIRGWEYFKIAKPKLIPCKNVFPNIDARGDRQPDNSGELCDGDNLGSTSIQTQHYRADIRACFSSDLKRWKGQLLKVDADIKWGLCPLTAKKKDMEIITSSADSDITEESYCTINNKIKATIEALNEGGNVEVYYPSAVITHEKKHIEQITRVIDEQILLAGELLDQLDSETYTIDKNEASDAAEAQRILQPFFTFLWNNTKIDIRNDLLDEELRDKRESEARVATIPPYKNLLNEIRRRAEQLNWQPCTE